MCGTSCFHFLPLLLGLYLSYMGKYFGAESLAETLREFNRRGIGATTMIAPGKVLELTQNWTVYFVENENPKTHK